MASNPNAPQTGNMTDAERAVSGTRGRTAERAVGGSETDAQRRDRERREADQRRADDRNRADANANRNAGAGRVERGPDGNTTRIGDRAVTRAGGTPPGQWPHVQTSAEARNLGADVTRDVAGNTGSMYTEGGPGAPQPGSREANDAATQQGGAPAGAMTTTNSGLTPATGTTAEGGAAPATTTGGASPTATGGTR